MLDLFQTGAVEAAFHKGLHVGAGIGVAAGIAGTLLLVTLFSSIRNILRRSA